MKENESQGEERSKNKKDPDKESRKEVEMGELENPGQDKMDAGKLLDDQSMLGRQKLNRLLTESISVPHLLQLSIGLAIALSVIKLVSVSHGDFNLAVSVWRHSGYSGPLFFVLISMVPVFIMLGTAYLVEYRLAVKAAGRGGFLTDWFTIYLSCAFIIYVSMSSWISILMTLGLVSFIALLDHLGRRRAKKKGRIVSASKYMDIRRKQIITTALVVAIPQVLLISSNSSLWTSYEQIKTKDDSFVGSVLSDDGEWTVILVSKPRALEYIKSEDIDSRKMCKPTRPKKTLSYLNPSFEGIGGINCDI